MRSPADRATELFCVDGESTTSEDEEPEQETPNQKVQPRLEAMTANIDGISDEVKNDTTDHVLKAPISLDNSCDALGLRISPALDTQSLHHRVSFRSLEEVGLAQLQACSKVIFGKPFYHSHNDRDFYRSSSSEIPDGGTSSQRRPKTDEIIDSEPSAEKIRASQVEIYKSMSHKPRVRNSNSTEESPTKRLRIGIDSTMLGIDNRSPTFEAQSYSSRLASQNTLGDTRPQSPKHESVHSPDRSSDQAQLSEPDLSLPMEVDRTLSLTSPQVPTESLLARSIPIPASLQTICLFILKSSYPRMSWVYWPDARLAEETLESTFEAVFKYSKVRPYHFLEVKLQTVESDYSFTIPRGRKDLFEQMKQHITVSHQKTGMNDAVLSVHITPKETNQI